MSSTLDHITPDDFPGLQEWLDHRPALAMMDEKELLLLLLYKLEMLQLSITEVRQNTTTHWAT